MASHSKTKHSYAKYTLKSPSRTVLSLECTLDAKCIAKTASAAMSVPAQNASDLDHATYAQMAMERLRHGYKDLRKGPKQIACPTHNEVASDESSVISGSTAFCSRSAMLLLRLVFHLQQIKGLLQLPNEALCI